MLRPVRRLVCAAAALLMLSALAGPAYAQTVPAPKPTSTEVSPGLPDPHPPLGGLGPDGQPVGGSALLSRTTISAAPTRPLPKDLTAGSWMLTDLDTGQILAARDPHGRYQPASILKTLTSLVLLPQLPGGRVVTVSDAAANAEGSAVGLVGGGKYTVDTLFKGLLLMSGNDAAAALAEAGGGVGVTVAAMNREAVALGAYDTFVQTPSGLDGWQQLTSAYDLTLILRAALDEPRFVAYDRTLTASLPAQTVAGQAYPAVALQNQSENFLDGVRGALVAKTGYTDAALHTYLCAAERGGRRLGIVFLRNQRAPLDQFQQASALFDWGFALPSSTTGVGVLAGPEVAPAPTPSSGSATGTAASGATHSGAAVASPSPSSPQPTRTPGTSATGRPSGLNGRELTVVLVGAAAVVIVATVGVIRRRRRRPS